jgi:hypothetical protein
MYDGLKLYRALVMNSSSTTGDVYVKIPAILGANETIAVSKVGRSPSGGVWAVPAPNTQIVVGVDDKSLSNVYLVYTSVDNTITNISSDVSTLQTDVSTLQTDVDTLQGEVDALQAVTPYTAATPMEIVSVVSTPYVVQASDAGKLIQVNSSSAVTLQFNTAVSFPTGVEIYVATIGTGKVTIGGTATVNSPGNIKTLTGQYSTAALVKLSSYWLLFGDLG